MGKKLYVGNLGYDVSTSDLEGLFSPHGTVESAQVIEDRSTGQSKGFGFVEMGSDAEAQAAMSPSRRSRLCFHLKGMVDLSLVQGTMPLARMLSQARTWRLSNRNSRISPLDRLSTFLTGI